MHSLRIRAKNQLQFDSPYSSQSASFQNSFTSSSLISPFVQILISFSVTHPVPSLSNTLKIYTMSSQRDCLLTFSSMQSRNYWKSMVPLQSSSISRSTMSTSSSLTLSPNPRRRNLRVRLEMLPVLSRSYILNTSLSSSICSILQELNSWFCPFCSAFSIIMDSLFDELLFIGYRMLYVGQFLEYWSQGSGFEFGQDIIRMCKWEGSDALLGHDVVEIVPGDLAAVGRSPLQHFLQLRHVHRLAQLLRDSPHVVDVDAASAVVIEQVEDAVDAVAGFLVAQLRSNRIQELFEVDFAAFALEIGNHVEDGWVFGLEAQALHRGFQLPILRPKYLGSILPVASVSNRLKASFNSSISSSVRPGLDTFLVVAPLAGPLAPLMDIMFDLIDNKTQNFYPLNDQLQSLCLAPSQHLPQPICIVGQSAHHHRQPVQVGPFLPVWVQALEYHRQQDLSQALLPVIQGFFIAHRVESNVVILDHYACPCSLDFQGVYFEEQTKHNDSNREDVGLLCHHFGSLQVLRANVWHCVAFTPFALVVQMIPTVRFPEVDQLQNVLVFLGEVWEGGEPHQHILRLHIHMHDSQISQVSEPHQNVVHKVKFGVQGSEAAVVYQVDVQGFLGRVVHQDAILDGLSSQIGAKLGQVEIVDKVAAHCAHEAQDLLLPPDSGFAGLVFCYFGLLYENMPPGGRLLLRATSGVANWLFQRRVLPIEPTDVGEAPARKLYFILDFIQHYVLVAGLLVEGVSDPDETSELLNCSRAERPTEKHAIDWGFVVIQLHDLEAVAMEGQNSLSTNVQLFILFRMVFLQSRDIWRLGHILQNIVVHFWKLHLEKTKLHVAQRHVTLQLIVLLLHLDQRLDLGVAEEGMRLPPDYGICQVLDWHVLETDDL